MVTIKVSDHHLDDERKREMRLFYATKSWAERAIKSINDGHFKDIFPDASCAALFSENRGNPYINVYVSGIPENKRKNFLFMNNFWRLNRMDISPWFRTDEIGLNVEFIEGDCCSLYSHRIIRIHE